MSARRLLIVNPNTNARITSWLAEEARRVAAPDVVIEAVNAESGFAALETPEQVEAASAAVVAAIVARAPDAALIGAFGDPGLEASRTRVPAALGLGQCGLQAAAAFGRFAILTIGAAMRGSIAERAERVGNGSLLTEVSVLPASIPLLVRDREAFVPQIEAEVQRLVRRGARCCGW